MAGRNVAGSASRKLELTGVSIAIALAKKVAHLHAHGILEPHFTLDMSKASCLLQELMRQHSRALTRRRGTAHYERLLAESKD